VNIDNVCANYIADY